MVHAIANRWSGSAALYLSQHGVSNNGEIMGEIFRRIVGCRFYPKRRGLGHEDDNHGSLFEATIGAFVCVFVQTDRLST